MQCNRVLTLDWTGLLEVEWREGARGQTGSEEQGRRQALPKWEWQPRGIWAAPSEWRQGALTDASPCTPGLHSKEVTFYRRLLHTALEMSSHAPPLIASKGGLDSTTT